MGDDVLQAARVTAAAFAPGLAAAAPDAAGPPLVIVLVVGGEAQVRVPGEDRPRVVQAGELALFPLGGTACAGEGAEGLSCSVACDAWLARTVLASLPAAVVHAVDALPSGRWIEATLAHGVQLCAEEGAGAARAVRLAEALLAEVLPLCLPPRPAAAPAWLTAAEDRVVRAVLAAMHEAPARPWTLATLAAAAHTSRSVLAERFQQRVGCPPMQYLAQWRLGLAARLLAATERSLMHIAEEVGYQTDTAFSRAFRREYGLPPAAWRRHARVRAPDARAGITASRSGR